jgi:ribosomal protein S18 acetylase RimI-like enzyme
VDVRPCTENDLEVLQARWPVPGQVHDAHYLRQQEGSATYLVAWDGAEPVGSGMVQWRGCVMDNARASYPDGIEVNHLQVRPALRGRGAGTSLLLAAERMVRERGHDLIAVSVAAENADAARLYQRLGYQPTGVIDVSSYTWTDEHRRTHQAVERNELLVKRLPGA